QQQPRRHQQPRRRPRALRQHGADLVDAVLQLDQRLLLLHQVLLDLFGQERQGPREGVGQQQRLLGGRLVLPAAGQGGPQLLLGGPQQHRRLGQVGPQLGPAGGGGLDAVLGLAQQGGHLLQLRRLAQQRRQLAAQPRQLLRHAGGLRRHPPEQR